MANPTKKSLKKILEMAEAQGCEFIQLKDLIDLAKELDKGASSLEVSNGLKYFEDKMIGLR